MVKRVIIRGEVPHPLALALALPIIPMLLVNVQAIHVLEILQEEHQFQIAAVAIIRLTLRVADRDDREINNRFVEVLLPSELDTTAGRVQSVCTVH